MKRALIVPDRCENCETCAVEKGCSREAVIRESLTEKPWVDFYRCAGCLECKALCTFQAVEEISQPCDGTRRMGW
jgi:TPP-dependent indolepyruvate ferredoxin oxidoreductase alpha subunit